MAASFFSDGIAVVCSLSDPDVRHIVRGIPSESIKRPILTKGLAGAGGGTGKYQE